MCYSGVKESGLPLVAIPTNRRWGGASFLWVGWFFVLQFLIHPIHLIVEEKIMKKLKKRLVPYCRCPNCGKKGQHFIPPIFSDKGFFMCKKSGTATSLPSGQKIVDNNESLTVAKLITAKGLLERYD